MLTAALLCFAVMVALGGGIDSWASSIQSLSVVVFVFCVAFPSTLLAMSHQRFLFGVRKLATELFLFVDVELCRCIVQSCTMIVTTLVYESL